LKNLVNSKKKEKSRRVNYNFRRKVKSSVELVKILKLKREKVIFDSIVTV
jgi:predicted glycosyltransferase involved in capsule biosynthesis